MEAPVARPFRKCPLLAGVVALRLALGAADRANAQVAEAPAAEAPAAGVALDLSYLPPDTVAAAVAFPKRSLAKPDAETLPLEVLSIWSRKELGVDVLTVEQALVALRHDGRSADRPPTPVIMLRAEKPIDKPKLLERLRLAGPPEDREGQSVYVPADPQQLAAMFPDERTVVLALADAMPTRQPPAVQTGELFTRLRAAAGQDDVVGVFALDPVRGLLDAELLKNPAPPPLSMLLDTRKHLVSVEVRASALAPARVGVTLHAKSGPSASNVEGAVNMVLAFGRMALSGQLRQAPMKSGDPELDAAVHRYTQRMFDRMFDQLKPKREGSDVIVRIGGDQGIATTGVLVALLLPAVQAAREAARRVQSTNNLKQLALAMHLYDHANGRFPARASFDKQGRPLLSWRVLLLPYLEQKPLYDQFHLDEPWDSEHNRKLIPRMPAVFATPNRPNDGKTVYLVPVGPGTVFEREKGTRAAEITDGVSKTILLVEADADRAVEWTRPADLDHDPERPLAGLGHLRPQGFVAALADGSVRFIANSTDPAVLRALFGAKDGAAIGRELD